MIQQQTKLHGLEQQTNMNMHKLKMFTLAKGMGCGHPTGNTATAFAVTFLSCQMR